MRGMIKLHESDILCMEQALLVVCCLLTYRMTRTSGGSMPGATVLLLVAEANSRKLHGGKFMIAW